LPATKAFVIGAAQATVASAIDQYPASIVPPAAAWDIRQQGCRFMPADTGDIS
jgi:hypothetical protein